VVASVGELQPRSRDQVDHCLGHQDLAGLSERADARSDVHANAAEIVTERLTLAGVNARPQRHS
jgi:hypothetical protein